MDNTDLWQIKEEFTNKIHNDFMEYSTGINKEEILMIDDQGLKSPTTKSSSNDTEQTIVSILCKIINEEIIDFEKYVIECSFLKNSTSFSINYDKKRKQFSKKTIFINLGEESVPIIFTEIDLEMYKFKEFNNENKFKVTYLKPNSIVQHDNDTYVTWFKNSSNENKFYDILKVTLWEKEIDLVVNDEECPSSSSSSSSLSESASLILETEGNSQIDIVSDYIEKKTGNFTEDNLYDSTIFDELFYKKTNGNIENLIDIVEKNKNTVDFLYLNVNIKINVVSLQHLKNKYGLLAEEIYPFSKINMDIGVNNRFFRNKLYKKILSKDICYWMINEYEKKIAQVVNENISSKIDIDSMPGVLSYIFFVSNLWFEEIKEVFDIKHLRLNLTDLYIDKYNNNNNKYNNYYKESFLILNISLSNIDTYNGGKISLLNNMLMPFDEDNISLEQGDLLLTNNKKKIKLTPIEQGDLYILTIISEIIY